MSTKKLNITLLGFSLIGLGVGYILTNSVVFGLCGSDAYTCRGLLNEIGDPLFYGMAVLAVVFFILIFIPRAFSAWWKFAIWYIPLAVLIFATIPAPRAWINVYPSPDSVYRWVSGIYLAVSMGLILMVSLKKKALK